MYKKEIERKFLVDPTKMPDLSKYPEIEIIQGYLNQPYDSLEVRLRGECRNDIETYTLTLKDKGTKIRNEITYDISKEEFESSIVLCGKRIIKKKRYLIPSSFDPSRIIELDKYIDLSLITCEYEAETEVLVDTLQFESWFLKEITGDKEFSNYSLALKQNVK